MAERFRHERGLLFFELFWDQAEGDRGIHLLEGEVRGEGPWKVADCVITVLGCHGTNPEQAEAFARWQFHLSQDGGAAVSREHIDTLARSHGAIITER